MFPYYKLYLKLNSTCLSYVLRVYLQYLIFSVIIDVTPPDPRPHHDSYAQIVR